MTKTSALPKWNNASVPSWLPRCADFAIAQLFSQGKGTKPNLLNAYVFGQLAKVQDTPQGNELASQLDEQPRPQQQRAQRRQ